MNFNFVSLLDFTALVQGLLLGGILIVTSKNNKPSLFLGLFLVFYSLDLVSSILTDIKVMSNDPKWLFLHMKFFLLSPVLFYVYAKNVISRFDFRKNYWMFIPGLIEILIFGYLFSLPIEEKVQMNQSDLYELGLLVVLYIGNLISIIVGFAVVRLVKLNSKQVLNYYSNPHGRMLYWLKIVAIYMVVLSLIILILFEGDWGASFDSIGYILVSILNVIFIFGVGLYGFKQTRIFHTSQELASEVEELNILDNEAVKSISEKDKEEEDLNLIKSFVAKKESFSNPKLNLMIVAHATHLSTRRVSKIINKCTEMNFNQFVNQYRIEEAKKILLDEKYTHYNLIGISDIIGFNSKTSFYNSFKHFVQMTPIEYKKANTHFDSHL